MATLGTVDTTEVYDVYNPGNAIGYFNGVWYVILQTAVTGNDITLYKSEDDGATWSVLATYATGSLVGSISMAVDSGGVIHCVYSNGSYRRSLYYKSYTVGVGWGTSTLLRTAVRYAYNACIAVDQNDDLWVVWEECYGATPKYALKCTDGVWGSLETVKATFDNKPGKLIINYDNVPVWFQNIYTYTRAGESNWTEYTIAAGATENDAVYDPVTGDLFYFYGDVAVGRGYIRKLPYGGAWSDIVAVSDSENTGKCCGGVDQGGIVHALYGEFGYTDPLGTGLRGRHRDSWAGAWEDPETIKASTGGADQLIECQAYIASNSDIMALIYWGNSVTTNAAYSVFIGSVTPPTPTIEGPTSIWRDVRVADPGRHPRNTGRNARRL